MRVRPCRERYVDGGEECGRRPTGWDGGTWDATEVRIAVSRHATLESRLFPRKSHSLRLSDRKRKRRGEQGNPHRTGTRSNICICGVIAWNNWRLIDGFFCGATTHKRSFIQHSIGICVFTWCYHACIHTCMHGTGRHAGSHI